MSASDYAHLQTLLADFRTAMLVTRSPSGEMRSRPMALSRREGDPALWFATSFESAKAADIVDEQQVNLSFQERGAFISVSGTAKLVHDRSIVRELWQDEWRVWFPDGVEDMSLVLVQVTPSTAEYWDLQGSTGIRFAIRAVKAYLRGEQPEAVAGSHALVEGPGAAAPIIPDAAGVR